MKIAIIGAPGSGKTTQADLLAKRLGVPVVAVGEALREVAGGGGPESSQVQEALAMGELVPEELALGLLREMLSEPDRKGGFILDGMPRTLGEAQEMEKLFTLDRVCHLQVKPEIAQSRLLKRGRGDDQPELIKRRLEIYKEKIEPILDFYKERQILVKVDASASPQEIHQEIASKL